MSFDNIATVTNLLTNADVRRAAPLKTGLREVGRLHTDQCSRFARAQKRRVREELAIHHDLHYAQRSPNRATVRLNQANTPLGCVSFQPR